MLKYSDVTESIPCYGAIVCTWDIQFIRYNFVLYTAPCIPHIGGIFLICHNMPTTLINNFDNIDFNNVIATSAIILD